MKDILRQEIDNLFVFRKTERSWHISLLAALCMGIPLIAGYFAGDLRQGLLASSAGLVILYLPPAGFTKRMTTLLICSFGMLISYTIGISTSFHPLISALAFGILTVSVHWLILRYRMRPPGSFFFIMICSTAQFQPFDLHSIPFKVGLVALGTMNACLLAFVYTLVSPGKNESLADHKAPNKGSQTHLHLAEALIMGLFMSVAVLSARLLPLSNPYWVPVSCLAVMQGVSVRHTWQRGFQRILGTFAGLLLTWVLLFLNYGPLSICIFIMLLQFIVEQLIVRNYTVAVMFITPMTILLSEAANPIILEPMQLISARFTDIIIGSLLGAAGGWFIHNQQLKHKATRVLRFIPGQRKPPGQDSL